MNKLRYALVAAMAVGLIAPVTHAEPLYVDDDAPLGGDGLGWNTAYRFLQDALYVAAGDPSITEIHVAQGTYKPDQDEAGSVTPGDREATFHLLNGVALLGGYAGLGTPDPNDRNIDLYETILTGDLLGDDGPDFQNYDENSYHVVTASGVDQSAVLEGFTITAGNADLEQQPPHDLGGGAYNVGGTPTVTDCTFTINHARGGGGMYNGDGGHAILLNCTFASNVADGSSADYGGGIYNAFSSPNLSDCTFSGNSAHSGGGIYNDWSDPEITGCSFTGNAGQGGGIYNVLSNPVVANCEFIENTPGLRGAGIYSDMSSPTIVTCSFTGNVVGGYGAAIYNISSNALIDGCVFTDNSAEYGGGALYESAGASVVTSCTFSGHDALEGGTLSIAAGSPQFIDCAIENSQASRGGAVLIDGGAAPLFTSCTFIGNSATIGGAIRINHGQPTIRDCLFAENSGRLGGVILNGWDEPSNTNVVGCTFRANGSTDGPTSGGAIRNRKGNMLIAACVFTGNTAYTGGALFCDEQAADTVVNTVFSGNTAGDLGGAMFVAGELRVTDSTLCANEADTAGGAIYVWSGGSAVCTNSIVWGHSPDGLNAIGTATVGYCNVEGGFGGPGNIDADPLFVRTPDPGGDGQWGTNDDDYGDLRLSPGSPCIDAGHNWAVPPDVADLDGDADTSELTPLDLDGNPRFAADENDFDPGCGIPVVVDMGAYEYQGDPFLVRLGDIDGNGVVNVNDFLLLLAKWGPCVEDCCLADFDLNGDMGYDDFLILLANWGS